MTVHMVRLFIEPPKGDAQNAIDNWVQNHTEWTGDPVDHSLVETNAAVDGTGTTYIRALYEARQPLQKNDFLYGNEFSSGELITVGKDGDEDDFLLDNPADSDVYFAMDPTYIVGGSRRTNSTGWRRLQSITRKLQRDIMYG